MLYTNKWHFQSFCPLLVLPYYFVLSKQMKKKTNSKFARWGVFCFLFVSMLWRTLLFSNNVTNPWKTIRLHRKRCVQWPNKCFSNWVASGRLYSSDKMTTKTTEKSAFGMNISYHRLDKKTRRKKPTTKLLEAQQCWNWDCFFLISWINNSK